jgi:hypothetical protein
MALLGAGHPSAPGAFDNVRPGTWEISRSATGGMARRVCLRHIPDLTRIGHPGERCTRTVLRDQPGEYLAEVTCGPGDFARSRITTTTPRALKVESQGIHRGEPFDLTLYVRRVGECGLFSRWR